MRSKKLIAFASALTMLGSLAAAVPASAAVIEITDAIVALPEQAVEYTVKRSTDGNSYTANADARAVTNTNGQNFAFGVKAQDETYTYRVDTEIYDNTVLTDGSDITYMNLDRMSSVYIPFGQELAVTKVEVKSSSNPYIIALVKSEDINTENISKVNETDAVFPLITSDNWYRINSKSYQKTDENYTLSRSNENTISSLTLKDDGTPVKYAGIFIDNNNDGYDTSKIYSITVSYRTVPENAVSFYSNNYYDDLRSAFTAAAAADGGEITLFKDYDVTKDDVQQNQQRITVGYNATISSDNKTITVSNNQSTGGLLLNQNRTLTINNTNISAMDGETKKNAVAVETGTLNINGGTISGNVYINKASAKLNVNGAVITGDILYGDASASTTITLSNSADVEGTLTSGGAAIYADSTVKIGSLDVTGEITDGGVVIYASEGQTLSASQVESLNNTGYELYTDSNGNLAIRAAEAEAPTVSIVQDSITIEYGTGDYASDVATGFIAEIKTTADSAAASALGVKVGDMDKGTKTITPVSGGASAWYKVIVKDISSADNVTVYVQ